MSAHSLVDEIVTETLREIPSVETVLKIFEAATDRSLTSVLEGALLKLVRRAQLANLDIHLAPGARVEPEVVNRDDPGAAPDERQL